MKILVLLSRVPYPLEKGDKLRAFHQIKCMSQKHEVVLCCLNAQHLHKDALKNLQPYCIDIKIITINKILLFFQLVKGLFSSKPLQVSYFYQKHAQKKIDRLIEKHLPQHIFCQLIRVTEYVKKYTIIPKTLDYMDAFSIGLERRIVYAPFYQKPVLQSEAKRVKQYEKEIFEKFEFKTIISAQDRQYIVHPENKSIQVIPNGIDTDYYQEIHCEKKYDLVFTGNMSYPPNVDCAVYLVQQILPLVLKTSPSVKLLISGVSPSYRIMALRSKNVTVSGWVEDMRLSYAQSKIFIAPMRIGTGLQNKLLEAMAMKIPCITSSLANNAIGATHGENILVGDTTEEFANHILTLLNDTTLYRSVADKAHKFVQQNFNWEETVNKWLNKIENKKNL